MSADVELAESMAILPALGRYRLRRHLASGGSLTVDYGWDWRLPGARAGRGCLVGVAFSPLEFARACRDEPLARDLTWLAEDAFPAWASAWVGQAGEALPPAAIDHLCSLLG